MRKTGPFEVITLNLCHQGAKNLHPLLSLICMHTQSKSIGNVTHRTDSSTTAPEHFTAEQTASLSTDSAEGGRGGKRGNSVAVIAGVSVTIVALVLLAAAAIITAVVVYLVWKKQAPQGRGFTRLPVISTDNKAVPV